MTPQPSHSTPERRRYGSAAALFAGLTLLLASGAARAEANGLKFGDGRLHPYFDFESRYDSAAAWVQPQKDAQYEIPGDMVLHFKPGLKLEVPSPAFAVTLNGNLDYVLYAGLVQAGTRNASHLAGDADLDLGFNKEGQVTFDLGDHVTRSDQVAGAPIIAVGALSLYNDAYAKLAIKPSGGALSFEPSYHLTTEFFSPLNGGVLIGTDKNSQFDPSKLSLYDYINHTLGLTGSWRFLPKTALLLDANYGVRTYPNSPSSGNDTLKPSVGIDTLKLDAGIAGLLTTHLSTIIKLGWGWDTKKGTYSSMVAQAELAYLFSDTGSLRFGYLRTFDPVGGGTYVSYRDDRGYAELRLMLGSKLSIHGRATLDVLHYAGLSNQSQTQTTAVGGEIGGDYEVSPWLTLGPGFASSYLTGSHYVVPNLSQFTRYEVFVHAQAMY